MSASAMSSYEEAQHSPSSSSKQKARLLLTMANAVEDSNARRRHQLQHAAVDAESIDQLILELEREASSGKDTVSNEAWTSSMESESSHHDKEGHNQSTSTRQLTKQQQQRHRQYRPANEQQVQLLYAAMISYRENADLKYQQLELRHLDLTQSFVELETRYRRLEAEQEAWKQSCQALQEAAVDGPVATTTTASLMDGSSGTISVATGTGAGSAITTTTTMNANANQSLRTSTVPILQQELKSLCSQRNQLLQANMELRKHLKQVQLQQTNSSASKKNNNNNCPRCHPELFLVRQRNVDEVLQDIMEPFQTSTTSILSDNSTKNAVTTTNQDTNQYGNHEIDTDNDNDDTQLQLQQHQDKEHHEDKMNLLGLQWGDTVNNSHQTIRTKNSNGVGEGQENNRPWETAQPTKQESIVWSPPSKSTRHASSAQSISPDRPNKAKMPARMTPTLHSFLPMKQKQEQSQTKHKFSQEQSEPSMTTTKSAASSHQEFQLDFQLESQQAKKIQTKKDIQVQPRGSHTVQIEIPVQTREIPVQTRDGPGISQEIPFHPAEGTTTSKDIKIQPSVSTTTAAPAEIRVNPKEASAEINVTSPETTRSSSGDEAALLNNTGDPSKNGMNRFGVLDEYGRSISYKLPKNATNSSGHHQPSRTTVSFGNANKNPNAAADSTANRNKSIFPFRRLSHQRQQQQQQKQHIPSSTRKIPGQQGRQRQPVQRHSVSGPPSTAAVVNARHLEYQQQMAGSLPAGYSGHSSVGSRSVTINDRNLESTSAPGQPATAPLTVRNSQQGGNIRNSTAMQGRVTPQEAGIRRPLSYDSQAPPAVPATTHSRATGRSGPLKGHSFRGSRQAVASASSPHPPILRDHSYRGGTSGRQQRHHIPTRAKSTEEKVERPSRPQSYFERIKKTLQQEI